MNGKEEIRRGKYHTKIEKVTVVRRFQIPISNLWMEPERNVHVTLFSCGQC
jgi:hypothetical protein